MEISFKRCIYESVDFVYEILSLRAFYHRMLTIIQIILIKRIENKNMKSLHWRKMKKMILRINVDLPKRKKRKRITR